MGIYISIMIGLAILNIAIIGIGFRHTFFSEYTISRRVIGSTSIIFGSVSLYNIFSTFHIVFTGEYIPLGLFSSSYIFFWALVMSAICFILNTDLRGGRISKKNTVLCMHISSVILGSILIYAILGGKETPIQNMADLVANFHIPNVWGRVALASICLVAFYLELFIPIIITKKVRERRYSRNFSYFIVLLAILPILFVFTMLGSFFISLILSFVWLGIILAINIVLLFSESFLTKPNVPVFSLEQRASTQMQKLEHRIYEKQEHAEVGSFIMKKLHKVMEEDRLYTNPSLTLKDLSMEVGTNRNKIADAIHNMGFAGFYEFINSYRLQFFKELARENPHKSITELHEEAGFNSRSTFYRFFQVQESMTPNDYVNGIKASA